MSLLKFLLRTQMSNNFQDKKKCCVIANNIREKENVIHALLHLSQDAAYHCHFSKYLEPSYEFANQSYCILHLPLEAKIKGT